MNRCPRCGSVDPSGRLAACPRCLLAELSVGEPADDGLPDRLPELGVDWLKVEARLGEGGMGQVFRARDERLGRTVAVKVLRPESASEPGFRARFAREARTLARLEHPGIVSVHDFGETPSGDSYLVMSYVAGGSLAQRLPLPLADAVPLALQLCEALAYAHASGVVHRDIKPENVLIGGDGKAKLSDFGIARLLTPTDDEGPLTRASVVMGTPGYMAPEARGGAAADPRMDIYAVGALLVHMLTGRHPGGDRTATPSADRTIPGPLALVLGRAMALDPSQRTPTAEALGRELQAVAAKLKLAAPGANELPPEEHTWRGAVALLAAVATAVALYAALVSLTPRTISPDETLPFTAFGNRPLADGRLLTQARFEVWPTLGAAVAIAIAFAAHGLLRRHWRLAGLDAPAPEHPLTGTPRVLKMGVVLFALFLGREALDKLGMTGVVSYVPVIGGCLELVMLYRFWEAVLEAQLTSRRLAREPWLWVGLGLSLFPPAYHLLAMAAGSPR